MTKRELSQLSHEALLFKWDEILSRDHAHLSELLLVLGEVDARKLFRPAGYPSMFAYCVQAKHMSEDVAFKRIRVARAARRFPGVLREIALGRLHLTGVFLLSRHLTRSNVDEILREAAHGSRAEIDALIARRFPQPDIPSRLSPVATPPPASHPAELPQTESPVPGRVENEGNTGTNRAIESAVPAAPSRIMPLAPERFALQTTVSRQIRDKLRRAQELVGHQIAPNDLESLLDCLLDIALPELEKRKFAATDRPQGIRRPNLDPRHIPAAVKREVWERDQGQCTFRSESGHRCGERSGLEFDHIDPVARGGTATVRNTRLLCPAHNQYEAEKVFGAGFMERKREAATG